MIRPDKITARIELETWLAGKRRRGYATLANPAPGPRSDMRASCRHPRELLDGTAGGVSTEGPGRLPFVQPADVGRRRRSHTLLAVGEDTNRRHPACRFDLDCNDVDPARRRTREMHQSSCLPCLCCESFSIWGFP